MSATICVAHVGDVRVIRSPEPLADECGPYAWHLDIEERIIWIDPAVMPEELPKALGAALARLLLELAGPIRAR